MGTKFPVPGDIFEDAYRIDAILGSGGFARVYRGLELGLDRPVALKILRPPVSNTQTDAERDRYLKTLMERFQREAMLLSRLRSPYTVTMYSYGQTKSGLLYMALEFIDGITLTDLTRAGKSLKPERVAKILKQVLMSLREAHSQGMLHRDLKPGNIMLFEHMGERDQAKLLDFGIAKLVDEAGKDAHKEDLTSDGTLIGTPRYMAPEQIQGGEVGTASDIYSLGLVAYELLVGRRAIEGDSSIQIISKQLTPISFQLPIDCDTPPRLRQLVNRMMHKDVSKRYGSAEQILADLNDPYLFEDMSIEMDLGNIETEIEDIDFLDIEDDERKKKKPPLALIFGVAGTLAVLLFMGLIYNNASDASGEPTVGEPQVTEEKKTYGDVRVLAKVRGKEVAGLVFVDGIEKGITPLKLNGEEILESVVVVKYTDPGTGDKLVKEQHVTQPRDVMVEFEPRIVEKVIPAEVKIDKVVEEKPKTTKRPTKTKIKRPDTGKKKKDPEPIPDKPRKPPKKKEDTYNVLPD